MIPVLTTERNGVIAGNPIRRIGEPQVDGRVVLTCAIRKNVPAAQTGQDDVAFRCFPFWIERRPDRFAVISTDAEFIVEPWRERRQHAQ